MTPDRILYTIKVRRGRTIKTFTDKDSAIRKYNEYRREAFFPVVLEIYNTDTNKKSYYKGD